MKRKAIVAKKAIPHPIPTIPSRVLSTWILLEYSGDTPRNTEVTRIIIAMTASHTLISVSVKGKFISITVALVDQTK